MKLSRSKLRKMILKEAYMAGRYFRSEADQQHSDSIEYGLNNVLQNACDGYRFECYIHPQGAATLTRHDGVKFDVYASDGKIEISTELEYDDTADTKGGSYYAEQLAETVLEIIEKKG